MTSQDFVLNTVKLIANYPQDVNIQRSIDERGVLLTINLNPNDCGLIIGRAGAVIGAIRTLARIVGIKSNETVSIRINDPRHAERR